mmetsp:Transcript_89907/g.290937  ORF Transcript_89907/g.290937 Transcript_89907/m.290937 type:complete len:255 (-) Transcript_89907:1686-2450(-)
MGLCVPPLQHQVGVLAIAKVLLPDLALEAFGHVSGYKAFLQPDGLCLRQFHNGNGLHLLLCDQLSLGHPLEQRPQADGSAVNEDEAEAALAARLQPLHAVLLHNDTPDPCTMLAHAHDLGVDRWLGPQGNARVHNRPGLRRCVVRPLEVGVARLQQGMACIADADPTDLGAGTAHQQVLETVVVTLQLLHNGVCRQPEEQSLRLRGHLPAHDDAAILPAAHDLPDSAGAGLPIVRVRPLDPGPGHTAGSLHSAR